jgi:hydrogenase maturation factor
MIMTCNKHQANQVINFLQRENILCTIIGEILPDPQERFFVQSGSEQPLVYHETDPYWEAFFNAMAKGWK